MNTERIRDHHDRRHDVEIPAGWRRVRRGALVPGDRHLNLLLLTDIGAIEWKPVEDKFLRANPGAVYSSAEWFGCLIRRENLG